MLQVRDAQPSEIVAACAVWSRAESVRTGTQPSEIRAHELVEGLSAAAAKPGARLLVGLAGGELVATIYGVPLRGDATKAQVAMLAVEPALWGRGYGAEMLLALTAALREQGCRHLRMNVDPANERARALYERHGWRQLGETEAVGDAASPELIYRLVLGASVVEGFPSEA